MLKSLCSHPPNPGAPRRTLHQASFSTRKHPQRSPLGEQAVLAAWGGRVRNATPPVLSSAAALLEGLFEHPEAIQIPLTCGKSNRILRIHWAYPQPAEVWELCFSIWHRRKLRVGEKRVACWSCARAMRTIGMCSSDAH